MTSPANLPTGACPASAVVMAASAARTPLAVADAATDARIMFVNSAFATLLETEAAIWVGRSLSELAGQEIGHLGSTTTARFAFPLSGDSSLPVALSIASVPGADGKPLCMLCSLVDARGEGADQAIALDAEMLSQVARAAGDLMSEAAIAAGASRSEGAQQHASELVLEAVTQTVHPPEGSVT